MNVPMPSFLMDDAPPAYAILAKASDSIEGNSEVRAALVTVTYDQVMLWLERIRRVRDLKATDRDLRAMTYASSAAAFIGGPLPSTWQIFLDDPDDEMPDAPIDHLLVAAAIGDCEAGYAEYAIIPGVSGSDDRPETAAGAVELLRTDSGLVRVDSDSINFLAHAKHNFSLRFDTAWIMESDLQLLAFLLAPSVEQAAPFTSMIPALGVLELGLVLNSPRARDLPPEILGALCQHTDPEIRAGAVVAAGAAREFAARGRAPLALPNTIPMRR